MASVKETVGKENAIELNQIGNNQNHDQTYYVSGQYMEFYDDLPKTVPDKASVPHRPAHDVPGRDEYAVPAPKNGKKKQQAPVLRKGQGHTKRYETMTPGGFESGE